MLTTCFDMLTLICVKVSLAHTGSPLGHKRSCSVPAIVANFRRFLHDSIGSVLVVGTRDLSPELHFLLVSPNKKVVLTFIYDVTKRRSSSNVHLKATLPLSSWLGSVENEVLMQSYYQVRDEVLMRSYYQMGVADKESVLYCS